MFDHRPDYARFFYEGLRTFRTRLELTSTETSNPVQLTITSFQHLPMYILYGWETGIYNEFRHLQSRGLSKAQLMELVMFAQLQCRYPRLAAGLQRGRQVLAGLAGRSRRGPAARVGRRPIQTPSRPGSISRVRELTDADHAATSRAGTSSTIGYVPNSVKFAMTYHPEFYKWHRARWEVIFQKLPKQTAPVRDDPPAHADGNHDALREAVLLGKAWGITREWLVPRLRGDWLLHRLRGAVRRLRRGGRHPGRQ